MNYKISLFLFPFLFFFTFCNQKANHIKSENIKLVLIFKNSPKEKIFTFPSGIKQKTLPDNLISYLDDKNILREYTPTENDTLTIETLEREYIEILHKYQGLENIYFLFKAGDTIEISYNENYYPFAKSLKSESLTKQYNFLSDISNSELKFGFESLTLLSSEYIQLLNNLRKYKQEVYNTTFSKRHIDFVNVDTLNIHFKNYVLDYEFLLDSLYSQNIIDDIYFSYFSYLLKMKETEYNICKEKYSNTQNKDNEEIKYLGLFSDSLIYYVSYNRFLFSYFSNIELNRKNVKKEKMAYAIIHNTKQVFDNIYNSDKIPPKTKSLLLLDCMEDIIENYPLEEIENYLSKFYKEVNDSVYLNYLVTKFQLFPDINELLLIDRNNNNITLNTLLKKHKGKLVYIDFWAGWCAPCIKSIPSSLKLKTKFKNENIVFIYISFDKDLETWQNAIKKNNLDFAENYLISNTNSDVLKDLNINSIPHYLIFDKYGCLKYKNAPGPGSKGIEEIFEQLLNE